MQVLENVFYTKVSRIRQLTNSPKFIVLLVLEQRKNSSLVLKGQATVITQKWCLFHRKIQPYELNIMDCFNQLIFTNMQLFKDRNIHIRVTIEISQ